MSQTSFKSKNDEYLQKFRLQMQRVKKPYMKNIQFSTLMFQQKVKDFQTKLLIQLSSQPTQSQKQLLQQNPHIRCQSIQTQQNQLNQLNKITQHNRQQQIQSSSRTPQQINKQDSQLKRQIQFKQWKLNQKYVFHSFEDVKQNFNNVFNKKLSTNIKRNQKKIKCYDFNDDQKYMVHNIFKELESMNQDQQKNKGFVKIQHVMQFFQKNYLFYLFYNIHPSGIKHTLKEFTRTRNGQLTQTQVFQILKAQRPLILGLAAKGQKNLQRRCIFQNQSWQQLRNIFNTLDTFGNQTIHVRPFFQKVKSYISNPHFINTPAIEFPQIQRIYTLKKIIFQLQNKHKLPDKMTWKQIKQLLINFQHKQTPTLDNIYQTNLQKATILFDSNYFLLQKQPIQILKSLFDKCPRQCDHFINTKFIYIQILQNQQIKPYMQSYIRQNPSKQGTYINLQQVIRSMVITAPKYIDLDQFLEYYSIKGPINNILNAQYDNISTNQEEQNRLEQEKKMLIKIRSLEKVHRYKYQKKPKKNIKHFTQFKQFKLKKKDKQTIRQKKVKQMIEEKDQQQLNQLNKKFKANPIPSQLNPQRILLNQKNLQQKKKLQKQQFQKKRRQDKEIINYLKANTKLLDPVGKNSSNHQALNQINAQLNKRQPFSHKPVPWFVQATMLNQIQQDKKQKRKQIIKATKLKYVRSWQKLPDFLQQQNEKIQTVNSLLDNIHNVQDKYQREHFIKANPVPDFHSLHEKFQNELSKKKSSFEPTKVKQFKLTSPKVRKQEVKSLYISPKNGLALSNKKTRQIIHSPPSNFKIQTTKKTEEWIKFNKKVKEEKQLQKKAEEEKERQRKLKQKNFAKYMSQRLLQQQQVMPDLKAQTNQKIKKHKKAVKNLKMRTQQQLSQIYNRVLQKPFLFQSFHQATTNSKASTHIQKRAQKKLKKKPRNQVIKNIQPIDMSQSNMNQQYYYNKNQHHMNHNQESYEMENQQKYNNTHNQSF